MKKEIVAIANEPNPNALWLHRKNNKIVLEQYSKKGWESIMSEYGSVQFFHNILAASTPIATLGSAYYSNQVQFIEGGDVQANTISSITDGKPTFLFTNKNTAYSDWSLLAPESNTIYVCVYGPPPNNGSAFIYNEGKLVRLYDYLYMSITSVLNRASVVDIGRVTNIQDLSTSTPLSFLLNRFLKDPRNYPYVTLLFTHNNITYTRPIMDVDTKELTFTILNNGFFQVYKTIPDGTGNRDTLSLISSTKYSS